MLTSARSEIGSGMSSVSPRAYRHDIIAALAVQTCELPERESFFGLRPAVERSKRTRCLAAGDDLRR